MNCPGSEQAAAYADNRLDAAESARFLEHCADCDDCRRTLAVLLQPRDQAAVPAPMETRAMAAIRRSLDRAPRPFRRAVLPRPQASPAGLLVAAALLVGFVGLVLLAKPQSSRVEEPRPVATKTPVPGAVAVPGTRPAPLPDTPKTETLPRPEPLEQLRPAPVKTGELEEPGDPKVEIPAEILVREPAKPEETRPEEAPKPVTHTVAARVLSEIQVTDISGNLSVNRKGLRTKERLTGVARLAEGDVLTADKPASFQVDGRHPVVLSENASISMAYAAQEQAPWLKVHAGEATVESTAASRWVVTDGQVAVAVKPAKARFTASRREARLAVAAQTETLYLQPDGGRLQAIHVGEEFHVGRGAAEVRPVDAATASRRSAAFEASRPRQRTIFYTSCDPADAKREHFFVQEGNWLRNDGLLSRERADHSAAAAIAPNPRFSWRDSLTLKFRYMTNCRSVEAQLRVDDKKYMLQRPLPVDRRNLGQWQSAEIPFALGSWPVFSRDDGGKQLVVSTEDKFDAIRFVVRQQDVFGDQRAYVLIDDIQVVEREKD
ncbi:MAG TPA: hypothetical protein VE981_04315 [Planctomycetota bacterium]|nr:hypothetical protein [Planctomycetota bacterium]